MQPPEQSPHQRSIPSDLPGAEAAVPAGRAGLAAIGVACATALAVGSLMEWATLGDFISIEGTQRRGDLTLILAVAAAIALILWGSRALDTRVLPALSTASFTASLYIVVDDAHDLIELSREVGVLARQLNPSIEPTGVLELGIGVFVTGAAAIGGMAVASWALFSPN